MNELEILKRKVEELERVLAALSIDLDNERRARQNSERETLEAMSRLDMIIPWYMRIN